MLPRISRYLVAVLAATAVFGPAAHAQKLETPLQLTSLEWWVADSDVVVRGVVVDVSADKNWTLVTFDVLESLKGDQKTGRLKFALQKFDAADAALADAKQAKREQLWVLKRQDPAVAGEAPDREKMLARHKTDLYAPFLPGRPGSPTLPVIPLGAEATPPAFLTVDLGLLKTSDQIVKAIRTAIAEPAGRERARSYSVAVPEEIAQQTGFSRAQNLVAMPVDRRLEEFARRLVQSPNRILPGDAAGINSPQYLLRLEGVKALRLFPSEKNLAIVRAWLDEPMNVGRLQSAGLVPALPSAQRTVALPASLAEVPEIHFQKPLTKALKTADAQLHTAVTIDGVHLLNHKKTDAFIESLIRQRPDLSGLSFAMGDACRMKPEAGRKFADSLAVYRKVESETGAISKELFEESGIVKRYKDQSAAKNIDPSASVAALMQVLAPEDGITRRALAKYLDTLSGADATRALARLAIFSEEDDVRAAAIDGLKKRDSQDSTAILVAGLQYPWPAVAERSSEAMVKLGRKDLVPHLISVLDNPDPRTPKSQEHDGKKVTVVRELVRLNHHHNCLLCHAPAVGTRETVSKEDAAQLEGLTAQVPVPSESMVAYYRPDSPDILVRFDVTYLRQDFSLKLKVADADPWPEMQRYDYLVRTREVTDDEAAAYRRLLQPRTEYRRAALTALRQLTGLNAEPTAAAWRKATGL